MLSDNTQSIGQRAYSRNSTKGGLIFVSCGQYTDREKQLGKNVCNLVRDLTPHEPYFAENENSLDAFTRNILASLDDAIALIAIMHPRGIVTRPDGTEEARASVWIEQEIAIAAFVTQLLGRPLKIAPYIHIGIRREGMREQLQLNPVLFRDDIEVIRHLRSLLPEWATLPATLKSEEAFLHERWESVRSQISRLPTYSREALKLLLVHGSATDYFALRNIGNYPEAGSLVSVLPGLRNTTNLVCPVPQQSATRNPEYDVYWEIKPEFVPLVRRYFAELEQKL